MVLSVLPATIKNLLILVHWMKLTNTAVCMDLLRLHNFGDDPVVKFFLKSPTKSFMYVGYGIA